MRYIARLAAFTIFGIYSGPISIRHDPKVPPDERLCGVLLDPPVRAALGDRSTTRARVAPRGAHRARRYPPGVAAVVARQTRRSEAGNDGKPGHRSLPRPQAVRARSRALRRRILPLARSALPGESGDRARGAGERFRGHRWSGGDLRYAREDRRSDPIADCGLRIADWK